VNSVFPANVPTRLRYFGITVPQVEIIARVIRTRPYLNGVRSGTRFLATSGVVIVGTPMARTSAANML
jgi:hypothetical protein